MTERDGKNYPLLRYVDRGYRYYAEWGDIGNGRKGWYFDIHGKKYHIMGMDYLFFRTDKEHIYLEVPEPSDFSWIRLP